MQNMSNQSLPRENTKDVVKPGFFSQCLKGGIIFGSLLLSGLGIYWYFGSKGKTNALTSSDSDFALESNALVEANSDNTMQTTVSSSLITQSSSGSSSVVMPVAANQPTTTDLSAEADQVEASFDTDAVKYHAPKQLLGGSSTDVEPQLLHSSFVIGQYGTVIISPENLNVNTTGIDMSFLSYRFNNVRSCRVERSFAPGVGVDTITPVEVALNRAKVVHDGSLNAPSLQVATQYKGNISPWQNMTVSFYRAPSVFSNLTLGAKQALVLDRTMLSATDEKIAWPNLVFSASNLRNCQINSAATGDAMVKFSQQLLNSGGVRIVSANNLAPSVRFSASNSFAASIPQELMVTFYPAPGWSSSFEPLLVLQGQTARVTNNTFSIIATQANPYPVVLKFSGLQHIAFSLVTNPQVQITSCTLDSIARADVQFTHDDTQMPPSGYVTLVAGSATSATKIMPINFDAAPFIVANQIAIGVGGTVIFSPSDLSVGDPDANTDKLIIFISGVQHGVFNQLTFQQKAIRAGNVSVTHDGSPEPLQYKVAASDGLITSTPLAAQVNMIPTTATSSNNIIMNSVITAVVLGVTGVVSYKVWDKWVKQPNAQLFSGDDLKSLVCRNLFRAIKLSGFLFHTSEEVKKRLEAVGEKLLKTVIDECQQLIDVNKMSQLDKELLALHIACDAREILVGDRSCCGDFIWGIKTRFIAEVTPEEIEKRALEIAQAVHKELLVIERNSADKPEEAKSAESFPVNLLWNCSSTSSPRSGIGVEAQEKLEGMEEIVLDPAEVLKENIKLREQAKAILSGKYGKKYHSTSAATFAIFPAIAPSSTSSSVVAISDVVAAANHEVKTGVKL